MSAPPAAARGPATMLIWFIRLFHGFAMLLDVDGGDQR